MNDLSNMSNAELRAKIAELEAAAKTRSNLRLTFKASEKGALSVYGIQRFPVTLYVDQWERLIDAIPAMQEFAKVNAGALKRKSDVATLAS